MKKLSVIVALVMLVSLSSCSLFGDKSGEYSPKEKISRIYYDEGDGKYLDQVWKWNKKELLSIDHYGGGSLSWTENFTYNKKGQIERVDDYSYDECAEYKYDGKKLSKVSFYDRGSLEEEMTFIYDGSKLSKVEILEIGKGGKNRLFSEGFNPMNLLVPEKTANKVKDIMNGVATRDMTTIEFEWEKDNVSKIEIFEDSDRYVYSFKYDDKLNPFTGFFTLYPEESILEHFSFSKNNPTQIIGTILEDGETYSDNIRLSYTYDGKFPTVQRWTFTDTYQDGWTGEIVTETYTESMFFEYE